MALSAMTRSNSQKEDNQKKNPHFPIVIIGGGMVGASLALAIQAYAMQPMPIAIIEPFPVSTNQSTQPSYDARSTALSMGSCSLLEQLNVWQSLHSKAVAIKQIHVSDQGNFGFTRMKAEDHQLNAFGHVVTNQALGQNLFDVIQQHPAIKLITPATATQLTPQPDGYLVTLQQGDKISLISTDLVVLADGGRSSLMSQLGFHLQTTDYHQTAVIANVTTSKPNGGQAFERFTEQGPMALLPLDKNRSALIWSIRENQTEQWFEASDECFLSALQKCFGYRLGRFTKIGQRHHYPLALKYTTEQIRPGLVVLGNAAHALHPVAGQGFNLALRDSIQLAKLLAENWDKQASINNYDILQHYLALQHSDQVITTLGSDWLVKAFSNQHMGLSIFRNMSLVGLDLLSEAKYLFTQQAMGTGFHQST